MRATPKNPVLVESGRQAARKRWGPPRVIRLDGMTPEQRRVVLAFVEMARAADDPAQAA